MSFASEVREELCQTLPERKCCRLAECYGILLYCNTFSKREIRIITENLPFARRLPRLFRRTFGLEFDRVWIINVNEGIIPFKKAADKGMIEEERRLFYVGMTRAKDRLTISSHKSVGSKKSRESSFLKNLIFFR